MPQIATRTKPTQFVAPSVLPTGGDCRRLRVERGLTVGQLARRAGVHRATIHRVEADDARASVRVRRLVAGALGLPVFPMLWTEDEP